MPGVPDLQYYQPLFSPWLGHGSFERYYSAARGHTLVSADRCYVLYQLGRQAAHLRGAWYEAGVYKGGTAALLARLLADIGSPDRLLRLFDTFEGMPRPDPTIDGHLEGDFRDTSAAAVADLIARSASDVSFVRLHSGHIPETFVGLEREAVAFAHIDVDIYTSVMDCCRSVYPRLVCGGFMVFDDYGFPTCPGARKAVDEYFADKSCCPLVLSTGQAVAFRSS